MFKVVMTLVFQSQNERKYVKLKRRSDQPGAEIHIRLRRVHFKKKSGFQSKKWFRSYMERILKCTVVDSPSSVSE